MNAADLHNSPVDSSTLWRMVVADRPGECLVLKLDRLGAPTKPTFLCQLRHYGARDREVGQPLTFFCLPDREPTWAINATMALHQGLEAGFALYGWEAGRTKAQQIREVLSDMGEDWTRLLGYCMSLKREVR